MSMDDDTRPQVDPSFTPRTFGFSEELQPQAAPVNTYVRPATPAPSPLHGLASALSGFSQDLAGFMKAQQGKQDAQDKVLGQAAAMKANGVGYSDAVSQGLMLPNNSPVFQQAYKEAQGSILGKRLAAGAVDAYQTWPGRNSQDPADFDKFLGGYIKQNLNTNDPDVLRGALPYVSSTSDALINANEKERAAQLYDSSVKTHIASSSMSIDNAMDVSLAKSQGVDYDQMWNELMADRDHALASGVRADDYDKQMVAMVHSKALEYLDPGILGMLKNKVPGQTYSYDDQDGSASTQQTLTTMEGRQAEIERLKAQQQTAQDKAELNDITGKVITQLAANPNAPIDPQVIARAQQVGDPAFAIHAREWAKSLAAPISDPEDPASILSIQQQILSGAPITSITGEIGSTIHNPATLTRLYDLYNSVNTKGMDAILQNPTVKTGLTYLRQSFESEDLFTKGMETPDSIQAQTDFTLAMTSWYRQNPTASYTDIQQQATKVLKDMQGTIPVSAGLATPYVRPEAITKDISGGQEAPAAPALTPQAIDKPAQPAAPTTPADPWSGEKPPELSTLPQDQQEKINQRAQSLGVDPQVIINSVFGHLHPTDTSTPTDHSGDQSLNQTDANVTPAKPVVDLVGYSEGTDRGRGYDETIGYGHWDPSNKPITDMTLAELQKFQSGLVQNGAPSSAVGRYQIIGSTLKTLISEMGLRPTDKFTPQLQDQMIMHLLNRRGLQQYMAGNLTKDAFADNLAKEWASLPTGKGASFYGQRVGVSRAKLLQTIDQIAPTTTASA